MGHVRKIMGDAAAWTVVLAIVCVPALLGAIKLMIWTFALGDWATGQGPAPWPF